MKKKISKENLIKILLILFSAAFAVPSIIYIIQNKTIYKFYWAWTWLFRMPSNSQEKILNATFFVIIFSVIFLLYICIVKNYKKMFKNKKQIIIIISIVAILFAIIIPYTSSDVYSYIANGWSNSKYDENPYYKSTGKISDERQVNDQMFNKVARCWKYETVVYGPLWTFICKILTGMSFGNIDIALMIFKIANVLVHLLNCFIIWKITKKEKFVLLYGLNPFILFEALTNVHNDIYIILFILLAIYFAVKKKNLLISVAFIAMATAIKYLGILILPFIVLYCIKDKSIKEKIKYCVLYGIEFLLIVLLFYLFYIRDFNVLSGLFIQQAKYNRSIMFVFYYIFDKNVNIVKVIQNSLLAIFAVYYIYLAIKMLKINKGTFSKFIRKYNVIIFIFTFILITNFNPWYIMWLFPTMMFLKGKSINTIIKLSYVSQIANVFSFALYSEEEYLGIPYFIILVSVTIMLSFKDIRKLKVFKNQKLALKDFNKKI